LSACSVVSFGLLKTAASVAFFAEDFGVGTMIVKSGFDGVKCIITL
jgi:hypothetical protein